MDTRFGRRTRGLRVTPLASCLALALALGVDTSALASNSSPVGPAWVPMTSGQQHDPAHARDFVTALPSKPGASARKSAPTRPAGTIEVLNCDDSGPGSLRDTILGAAENDVVDLSNLSCSTITLTTGYISVGQDDLSISGPGPELMRIDGDGGEGVIQHFGSGTLGISGVSVGNSKYYSSSFPRGGCLYSVASMSLYNTMVSGCAAIAESTVYATGGAIYTRGDLTLINSTITNSFVESETANARGGGVYVKGDLLAKYSTINGNFALASSPYVGVSGAAEVRGGSTSLIGTTISDNFAYVIGAMASIPGGAGASVYIAESTISGNSSTGNLAGIYTRDPIGIYNSTIAFNDAGGGNAAVFSYGAPITLQSSIIADNLTGGAPYDLGGFGGGGVSATGADNLITTSSVSVPIDTITDCPRLGRLADNGGPTRTHALLTGSPALDAGNNERGFAFDQRGLERTFGPTTDIGAFEWQGTPGNDLFHSGFDPGCDR
jgi:hypothetical protein